MTDATFTKVSPSDKPLYGPRKLLLCGFSPDTQSKFVKVLEYAGMVNVPRIWVTHEQVNMPISKIIELPEGSGFGVSSQLPRAVVVSGVMEKELIALMTVCRKTGMKDALWATLTPTSETWDLQRLLSELAAERDALSKKKGR